MDHINNDLTQIQEEIEKTLKRQKAIGNYIKESDKICDICGCAYHDYYKGHELVKQEPNCRCAEKQQKGKERILLTEPMKTFKYEWHIFRNFNKEYNSEAFYKAYRYAETFNKNSEWLFFVGHNGTGKSFLQKAICTYVQGNGFTCLFGSVRVLADHIRDRLGWDWSQFKIIDLLAIDDIGRFELTEWQKAILGDIIDYRQERNLACLFSTDRSQKELETKIDRAIYDRINGFSQKIILKGESMRGINNKCDSK